MFFSQFAHTLVLYSSPIGLACAARNAPIVVCKDIYKPFVDWLLLKCKECVPAVVSKHCTVCLSSPACELRWIGLLTVLFYETTVCYLSMLLLWRTGRAVLVKTLTIGMLYCTYSVTSLISLLNICPKICYEKTVA